MKKIDFDKWVDKMVGVLFFSAFMFLLFTLYILGVLFEVLLVVGTLGLCFLWPLVWNAAVDRWELDKDS